jgi:hypothetical protein
VVLEEAAVSVVVRKQMLAQMKLEYWTMILKYSTTNDHPNLTIRQELC